MKPTLEAICELVSLHLGARHVGPGDDLVSDLGAESADVVNLVALLEERYGVEIDEEELPDLRTVADLFHRVARGP